MGTLPEPVSRDARRRAAADRHLPFTRLPEVERAIPRALSSLDLANLARAVSDATDRARGRI